MERPLWELRSAGCFVINDHPVYTFHGVEGLGPRSLVDTIVRVDGILYHVRRVESFCTVNDPVGSSFGLMLDPNDDLLGS